ncbi:hypothetical protein ACWDS7_23605, partial [Streptosporangium sp. NPDC003464]
MDRTFTVEEARALMPALLERADEFVSLRGDLAVLMPRSWPSASSAASIARVVVPSGAASMVRII